MRSTTAGLAIVLAALSCHTLPACAQTRADSSDVTFERADISVPPVGRTKGGIGAVSLASLGITLTLIPAVPIQLPNDAYMLKAATVYSDLDSYSAVLHQQGIAIQIHGSRIIAVRPDASKSMPLDNRTNISIRKTETGYEASTAEFGANYLVAVECHLKSDDRCSAGGYVYELVKSLVVYPAK